MLPRIPGRPVSPTGGIGSGVVVRNAASGETTRLYTSNNSSFDYNTRADDSPSPQAVATSPSTRRTTSGGGGGGGWRAWWNNDALRSHHHSAASFDDDEPSNNVDTHPLSYGTVQTADTAAAVTTSAQEEEETDHLDGEHIDDDDGDEEHHGTIALLTRRLRCLFGVVTLPIVPLGTLSCLTLVWMLYAALVLDNGLEQSCAQPLHFYAYLSLAFLLYAPNHARIRTFVLLHVLQDYNTNYTNIRGGSSRDNSNLTTMATRTPRPASVRRYDQIFHTIALFYVYGGITLISACRDDDDDLSSSHLVDNATTTTTTTTNNNSTEESGGSAADGRRHRHAHNSNSNNDYDNMNVDSMMMYNTMNNACQATCPHLYPALRVYVTTLELFTFSLILPLLFLPCLYLYFIRRTMADAEALAVLQERLRDEEALRRNGGVTADEIMSHLEEVQLYLVTDNYDNRSTGKIVLVSKPCKDTENTSDIDNTDGDDDAIKLQPKQQSTHQYPECRSKECCICMENFTLHHGYNSSDDDELTQNSDNDDISHENSDDIETGYSSFESMSSSSSPVNVETTQLIPQHQPSSSRTTNPWRDTQARTSNHSSSNSNDNNTRHVVVRSIKCGHLFHKRCIASWVGGRWELDSTAAATTTNTNGREESSSSRRARRTTCPLCRQDLRPDR